MSARKRAYFRPVELHIWQRRLAADDWVLRGCEREPPQRLLRSMLDHAASPYTEDDEFGLSIACVPGLVYEHMTIMAAKHLRQSHYRAAQAGDFEPLGLVAIWDHRAHGLILSPEKPTLELAAEIAARFSEPRVNPYYEERSRRRGH